MEPHRCHLTVGGISYEYLTFYRGMGHRPPQNHYDDSGPNPVLHSPEYQRPSLEPDRDEWSVELPGVLWLMDKVSDGTLSIGQARELLVDCTSPAGGCCWDCEQIQMPEADLLAYCKRERDQWLTWWNAVTGESHPYAVSRSSIHRWDCRYVIQPEPPTVITSKHQYMLLGNRLDPEVTNPYRRLTTDEARKWLVPYRGHSRPPRCKACVPALPDAWRDTTSDVPSTH